MIEAAADTISSQLREKQEEEEKEKKGSVNACSL
jgi:hypothetical protein